MKMTQDGDTRYNEELYELLDGRDIVKYIKFKRLYWAGHKSKWLILEYQNSTEWKISCQKTCEKTTNRMGR